MKKCSAVEWLLKILPLLLAVLIPRAEASVLVCDPEPIATRKPLDAVETNRPLFTFDSSGRFFRGSFQGGKREMVSDHGFVGVPYVRPSSDGRWLIYSGLLKTRKTIQFWLYDKQQGTDRLVLEKPDGGWAERNFSPDGRSIAIFASHGRGWPSEEGVGLYLVDTVSAQTTLLGNPSAVAVPNGDALAFWSQDGSEVLVYIRASPPNPRVTEYYRLPLATRAFERISGRYDGMGPPTFLRGATRIPVHSSTFPLRSMAKDGTHRSPDGFWTASRTDLHIIEVAGRDGQRKIFRAARQDLCGEIDVMGWVDSRYFVYQSGANIFLGDARTGRSGFLFYDISEPGYFDW